MSEPRTRRMRVGPPWWTRSIIVPKIPLVSRRSENEILASWTRQHELALRLR
jgi:hypothetical protein